MFLLTALLRSASIFIERTVFRIIADNLKREQKRAVLCQLINKPSNWQVDEPCTHKYTHAQERKLGPVHVMLW